MELMIARRGRSQPGGELLLSARRRWLAMVGRTFRSAVFALVKKPRKFRPHFVGWTSAHRAPLRITAHFAVGMPSLLGSRQLGDANPVVRGRARRRLAALSHPKHATAQLVWSTRWRNRAGREVGPSEWQPATERPNAVGNFELAIRDTPSIGSLGLWSLITPPSALSPELTDGTSSLIAPGYQLPATAPIKAMSHRSNHAPARHRMTI